MLFFNILSKGKKSQKLGTFVFFMIKSNENQKLIYFQF